MFLKYCIGDDDDGESDATFDQMEHVGMLMYIIASHQKQLRALVRNPQEYSRKCEDLPVKHDFKQNPTSKSLKNWWISETVTTQTKATVITPSARPNLLADLGSDSDSDHAPKQSKKEKPKKKAQQPATSSSSSTSSDHEPSPPPKKQTRKRKPPQLELSEDDLGGPLGPSDAGHRSPSQELHTAASTTKSKSKGKKSKKKTS